jgi:DNA-binding XRE family transcriptional regulator
VRVIDGCGRVAPEWPSEKIVAETESFAKAQSRLRVTLGRRVKDLRLAKRLSQSELAGLAKVRRALISEIERGLANPTLDSVVCIALALHVEAAELLAAKRRGAKR